MNFFLISSLPFSIATVVVAHSPTPSASIIASPKGEGKKALAA